MALNPLISQAGNPSLGQPQSDPLAELSDAHDSARARLKKLDSSADLMTSTRKELDHLAALGDLVEDEDVIRSVGKIVAAGGSPMAMASMLADAPMGNREALRAWVAQKDMAIRQVEGQMAAAQQQARHAVGLAGLRLLAGHAVRGSAEPAPQLPEPQPTNSPALGQGPAGNPGGQNAS